eukprot:12532950-Alexandrium_andersonii.AAC.1
MPRVGGVLPWKESLEYGHDAHTKNFDPLWQTGPLDVRDRPEDPPAELDDFPSFVWGSQHPRYEEIRKEVLVDHAGTFFLRGYRTPAP